MVSKKLASEFITSAIRWGECNVSIGKPTRLLIVYNVDKHNYFNSLTLLVSMTDIVLATVSLKNCLTNHII